MSVIRIERVVSFMTDVLPAVSELLTKFLRKRIFFMNLPQTADSIQGEKISEEWFKVNYPDWNLTLREASTGKFYFLFNQWNPDNGVIWFDDNFDCRLERMKVEEVPEGIKAHLALMSLFVVEPPPLPELNERQRGMLVRTQIFSY